MHGCMHSLFTIYNNYYKSMARGKVLSWRMGSCKVKRNIYSACQIANNWSPKNIRSYRKKEIASSRDGWTTHGRRRRVKSSLLLHQKLRPVQQIDVRARRASRSLVHFAPALLPAGQYASASWPNLGRVLIAYLASASQISYTKIVKTVVKIS